MNTKERIAEIITNKCYEIHAEWWEKDAEEIAQALVDAGVWFVDEKMLMEIYRVDKTPDYGYGMKKSAQTREGHLPGTGKRWLTPREIIRNFFGVYFWEKHEKFLTTPAVKEK